MQMKLLAFDWLERRESCSGIGGQVTVEPAPVGAPLGTQPGSLVQPLAPSPFIDGQSAPTVPLPSMTGDPSGFLTVQVWNTTQGSNLPTPLPYSCPPTPC